MNCASAYSNSPSSSGKQDARIPQQHLARSLIVAAPNVTHRIPQARFLTKARSFFRAGQSAARASSACDSKKSATNCILIGLISKLHFEKETRHAYEVSGGN